MLLVIVLLVAAVAVVLGFYAQANQGSHDVTLFGNSWHTWDWVPAAIVAGAVAVILLGAMIYTMVRIGALQRANAQLREEVALFKLERAVPATAPERGVAGRPERRILTPSGEPIGEREPAARPSERDGVPAAFARTPAAPPAGRAAN
jgi:uncharacterized integral membrane protein